MVTDREASYARLFEFLGIEDSAKTREYFDNDMPAERVRIGKYRGEISDWQRLDREYEKALARLST